MISGSSGVGAATTTPKPLSGFPYETDANRVDSLPGLLKPTAEPDATKRNKRLGKDAAAAFVGLALSGIVSPSFGIGTVGVLPAQEGYSVLAFGGPASIGGAALAYHYKPGAAGDGESIPMPPVKELLRTVNYTGNPKTTVWLDLVGNPAGLPFDNEENVNAGEIRTYTLAGRSNPDFFRAKYDLLTSAFPPDFKIPAPSLATPEGNAYWDIISSAEAGTGTDFVPLTGTPADRPITGSLRLFSEAIAQGLEIGPSEEEGFVFTLYDENGDVLNTLSFDRNGINTGTDNGYMVKYGVTSSIISAVVAGSYPTSGSTSGEFQGTPPDGSVRGMKFKKGPWKYEFMPGDAGIDVWVRTPAG